MQPIARQCFLPVVLFAMACTPGPEGPAVTYVADTSVAAYNDTPRFPPWLVEALRGMNEPPLRGAKVPGEAAVLRFTWSRSFHPDVSIRVKLAPASCEVITSTITHGRWLFGPPDSSGAMPYVGITKGVHIREDSVRVPASHCYRLDRQLDSLGVWESPSVGSRGLDGAEWFFERVDRQRYRWAHQQSPRPGDGDALYHAGIAFLFLGRAFPDSLRKLY